MQQLHNVSIVRIFAILALLAFPVLSRAQTIVVSPITKTVFCVGSQVAVHYQASGSFNLGNVFKVQLSDANGSFAAFTNVGASTATTGTISTTLSSAGDHYRVRVISTDPYIISADNGTDLQATLLEAQVPVAHSRGSYGTIVLSPRDLFWPPEHIPVGFEGDPIAFGTYYHVPGLRYSWLFFGDANPQSSTDSAPAVAYASSGHKTGLLTVSNDGGCNVTDSFSLDISSCQPQIPATAHIVTGTESGSYPYIWVKAGGNYQTGFNSNPSNPPEVFIEPGGTASGNTANFFVRKGASYAFSGDREATAILDRSVRLYLSEPYSPDTIYCGNLTFDYSQFTGGVDAETSAVFGVSQTYDHLKITSDISDVSIRLFSLLGTELLSQRGTGTLDIDLSQIQAGIYFAVIESGERREVRKIAVVH